MSALAMREAPPGLVLLSEVLARAAPGGRPAAGFEAWVRGPFVGGSECKGGPYRVTAVLERTAVLQVAADDRRLARHDVLLVDARSIECPVEAPSPNSHYQARRPRASAPATPEARAARPAAVEPRRSPAPTLDLDREPPADGRGTPTCSPGIAGPPPPDRHSEPAPPASAVGRALQGLPAQVQDLLDNFVTLARYAHDLEDELERMRTLEREVQRIAKRALAAAEHQP